MQELCLSFEILPAATKRLRLAYSGGLDSTVLAHALHKQVSDYKLELWHINHGLQDNAAEMEAFAREQAHALGLPIRVDHAQLEQGANLEARARVARYALFRQHLQDSDVLVTAHHMNDQAETLLMHALRGSGPDGLSAMRALMPLGDSHIFRPLLSVSRVQLERYAHELGLVWVEDASNQDHRFDRNYIRHQILPELESRWPAALEQLHRVCEIQQQTAEVMQELAYSDLQDATIVRPFSVPPCLAIDVLQRLSVGRRINLIRHWIIQQGFKPVGYRKQQELIRQLDANQLHIDADDYSIRSFQRALYLIAGTHPEVRPGSALEPGTRAQLLDHCGANDQGQSVELHYRRDKSIPPTGFRHRLKRLYQKHRVPPWWRDQVPLIFVDDELAGLFLGPVNRPYSDGS